MIAGPSHQISVIIIGVATNDPAIMIRVRRTVKLSQSYDLDTSLLCLIIAVHVSSAVMKTYVLL